METNEQVCPKTWLAESILVTIFCCIPFGVVGIVYAAKVEGLFSSGNYEAAQQASNTAGKWTKYGFFTGLAFAIIYLLILAIAVFAGYLS